MYYALKLISSTKFWLMMYIEFSWLLTPRHTRSIDFPHWTPAIHSPTRIEANFHKLFYPYNIFSQK